MKILIAGSDINAVLTAQYIKLQNSDFDIFMTSEESDVTDSWTNVKIKENDIESICEFVKNNGINFVIAVSQIAIINGIADRLRKENITVFSPLAESARITYFNSIAKKIMYKLKINTPKFGIFDRENIAVDYIRRSKFPIVIKNDFVVIERITEKYGSFSKAKAGLQKIFENGNEKIIIENYIDTPPVYIYFLTDGYNALPLISVERTEKENLTILKACSEKVNVNIIMSILKKAVYPLLDDITKYEDNYTGILGLKIKLNRENFQILEFYNGFQSYDFQSFLSLLDEDLFKILYDCANSCMADNYDYINLTQKHSYSIAVKKSCLQNIQDEENDFIQSEDEDNIIYTSTASTLNMAKRNLIEYINYLCINDKLKAEINDEANEVLRI
ncbi:MAG: hypothetical protein LUG16_04445 [Candidatus Gastranaerophilales bacterium]|nr:hypothetical protein [Candidatus Gastranaerophilales bacterium]